MTRRRQSDNARKIRRKQDNERLTPPHPDFWPLRFWPLPRAQAETIRIGLPTKTYWPTIIAETAVRQKLFEKEGIKAELTIYRGGAEAFEAMAAGAADIILDAPSLVSAGRKKGVMCKIVAGATIGYFGWHLMVPAKSTLEVKDLNGKKVGITVGRLRLGSARALDHPGQQDRFHPRAARRRRPGAEPAGRQYRRRRGLFAAELPDAQIWRSAHA